jgi:butyryl-CoA dehydrogenase
MNFSLTEEQEMIRGMCRDFAENEVRPLAQEIDKQGQYPAQLMRRMAELGLMGACVPEKYGGAGMDTISYILAVEEISRACASTAIVMIGNNSLACSPISEFGSDQQKKDYLLPLAKGEKLGCLALTELHAGSDAGNVSTTAELYGDYYLVNGQKIFTSNAAEAQVCILFVSTDRPKRHRGMSALIVEMDTPGFTVAKNLEKLGVCASSTCELRFENMKVPAGNLLGKQGDGFKIVMKTLDAGRIAIAAQALGIARAAFEKALQFSKERTQFGKPISANQAIQWMLADMATEMEAARWLIYHAAWLRDQGLPHSRESAMAKVKASEVSNFVCNKALQIHGGYGYMEDYHVERHLRDARITEIYEGTSEIQRLVIANSYLRD